MPNRRYEQRASLVLSNVHSSGDAIIPRHECARGVAGEITTKPAEIGGRQRNVRHPAPTMIPIVADFLVKRRRAAVGAAPSVLYNTETQLPAKYE